MGFSREMLSHATPSSYSHTRPCQILVRHLRSPPPAQIFPPLPEVCIPHGSQGQGAPEHACKSVPIAASPGATAGRWPGCQLFQSPRSSWSYKTERAWKLKQEKQWLGARGLLGQLWKDNAARVTTLFIGALGETYMVRKQASSYHKTQPCSLRFAPALPNLLKEDNCQAQTVPTNHITVTCPHTPYRMWGPENQPSISHRGRRGGGMPLEGRIFLGATQPGHG